MLLLTLLMAASQPPAPPPVKAERPARRAAPAAPTKRLLELQAIVHALPETYSNHRQDSGPRGM